jgi:N-acetylated-alpha-linked acidic dipeptidase
MVHLKVKSDWNTRTLYDVIAKIPGTTEADQWIIRGNHHDAWVNGAEDPISGLVAELEEARAFGELLKQGWKPKRTIIYAAWDGEEPGLLGSTEWAEAHDDELKRHAVIYINSDTNGRGFLGASGSHTLESFVNSVARDIEDPETKTTAWKRMQARRLSFGSADDRRDARTREDLHIGALGSGSDYSPFLQHLGIAALNMSYGGEDDGGIYHSIYDDFYWFMNFSDSSFAYGKALAQTMGVAVMRLASADLLPFTFTNLAETARSYATELQRLRDSRNDQINDTNRMIDDGVYLALRDPRNPVAAPARRTPPPQFNFAPLLNALDSLTSASRRYDRAAANIAGKNPAALKSVNAKLVQAERALT